MCRDSGIRRPPRRISSTVAPGLSRKSGCLGRSYRLLVAIEAALALCYHVSAKSLHKIPEEYAACFGLLYEAGLISESLTKRLQQMARLRNLLVHVYWKIDYSQVYNVIRGNLGDLRAFAAAMAQLV